MTKDPEYWHRVFCKVRDEMALRTWSFVSPISLSDEDNRAQVWGTGNYVSLCGSNYLLTNCHVVRDAIGRHLAHLPGPTDDYVGCYNTFITDDWPVDVALMRMGSEWESAAKTAIPASAFDRAYSAVPGELLFWLGFPGTTATRHESVTDLNVRYNWFGGALESRGVPIVSQEVQKSATVPPGLDPDRHVRIHFSAQAVQEPDQPKQPVPNPKGMSGSLLWDTKFLATTGAGLDWTPSCARVCGLVWAGPSKPEEIVATRVEFVREPLLAFLRHEAAYLNWLERGSPLWDDLVDWEFAERTIVDLE